MNAPPEHSLPMRALIGLNHGLAVTEYWLLSGAIMLMALNTIANIVARLGFSTSLFFSEELNQFLIVLVTFVGASAAARQGRHIRMSALTDMLPERLRSLAFAFIYLVTAAIVAMLAWYAGNYLLRIQGLGRVTPALQWPVWITLLWLPFGLALTALQFAAAAIANLRGNGVFLAAGVREQDAVDMPNI